jgi:hypothetical protein
VNDSDPDGGSFSEVSDSNTCKVNSPFISSSEEEEVVQPEPDRSRKRTGRAFPKHANTDIELGWKEKVLRMERKSSNGSETCILRSTRNKLKFPYNSIHLLLGCLKYSSAQKCSNLYRRKQTNMQHRK